MVFAWIFASFMEVFIWFMCASVSIWWDDVVAFKFLNFTVDYFGSSIIFEPNVKRVNTNLMKRQMNIHGLIDKLLQRFDIFGLVLNAFRADFAMLGVCFCSKNGRVLFVLWVVVLTLFALQDDGGRIAKWGPFDSTLPLNFTCFFLSILFRDFEIYECSSTHSFRIFSLQAKIHFSNSICFLFLK